MSLRKWPRGHGCELGDPPYAPARRHYVALRVRDRNNKTSALDIEHSLRWHDPGRFNGYVLSQHLAGTPVDAVNLRDALCAVKERAAAPALAAPPVTMEMCELGQRPAVV